jgi:hypothetical protein
VICIESAINTRQVSHEVNHKMRNLIIVTIALLAAQVFPSGALGQGGRGNQNEGERVGQPSIPPPEGWKRCPRCQNNEDRRQSNIEHKVDGHAFDPKDLTGVWGYNGIGGVRGPTFRNPPPMTPLGKELHLATYGEKSPTGEILHTTDTTGLGGGSKINCDPYGTTRLYTYNYGFEFIMLPDRVIQFFELTHTWRTIWTDGRKLPVNPPELRWLGWNVGHWEGDTFVVESTGYDDRGWIDAANPDGGWVHSDEMKVVERYRRINYGTLEAQLTVIDPKIYTEPWVTPKATVPLVPGAELGEDFCIPSDYAIFNEEIFTPASGAK